MFSRSAGVIGTFVLLSVLPSGCATPAPRAATRAASDVPAIAQSPAFASASALFRAGSPAASLAQIETLSRRPYLSTADRLFLDNQAAICRRALSGATPLQPPVNALGRKPKSADCGARSLLVVCRTLGIPASLPALTQAAHTKPGVGASLAGLQSAARSVGLTATGVQVDADALRRVSSPAIAWVDGDHFVAVTRIRKDTATVSDSNKPGKEEVALGTLLQRSGGVLLLVKRRAGTAKP